jgi:hypothetical protein
VKDSVTWSEKFYQALKRDISEWYDKHTPDQPDYKAVHLAILQNLYRYERFDSCENLEAERAAFLTEVHEAVWGS